MTISPDEFSAEEEFPNNERRASSESDKDSIVHSVVIYLCMQSWATHGAGNDVHYCDVAQLRVSTLSNDGQFVHRGSI